MEFEVGVELSSAIPALPGSSLEFLRMLPGCCCRADLVNGELFLRCVTSWIQKAATVWERETSSLAAVRSFKKDI